MDKVFERVMETLKARTMLYKVQPVECLEDDEILAVMKMKLLRVRFGTVPEKRLDDLIDLISYAVVLAKRWINDDHDQR